MQLIYELHHEETSDQALAITAVKPPKKRKRVEILDKGSRGIILSAIFVAKKALISCTVTGQLICGFVIGYNSICRKHVFMPPPFVECGRALSLAHVRLSVCRCVLLCVPPSFM